MVDDVAEPEDVLLPVTPGYGDDGGDTVSAKEFVETRRNRCRGLWAKVEARAKTHESYVLGDQGGDDDSDTTDGAGSSGTGGGQFSRNLLRTLVPARVARQMEGRPAARATPNNSYGMNPIFGEIANEILRHVDENLDVYSAFKKAVYYSNLGGTSAVRAVWDPDDGPRWDSDEPQKYADDDALIDVAGKPMGTVKVDALTLSAFCPDNVPVFEDSEEVTFRRTASWIEAKSLLMNAGRPEAAERISPTTREARGDDSSGGYEVLSTWVIPNAQFERGLRIVSVDGEVVEHGPFPYPHGELPLCVIKDMLRTKSPWGDTWLKDGVRVQQQYDRAVEIKARRLDMLKTVYVCVDKNTNKGLRLTGKSDVKKIPVADKDNFVFEIKTVDDVKREVFDAEEREALEAMSRVSGITQGLVGGSESALSAPGKSIAYINAAEGGKLTLADDSLRGGVRRIYRQILSLYHAFAPDILLSRIVGEHLAHAVPAFKELEDLEGLNVVITDASGITDTPDARKDAAVQAGAAGQLDPAIAAERAATGQADSIDETMTHNAVAMMVEGVLNGGEIDVDTSLDPATAIRSIREFMAMYANHENAAFLRQLHDAYAQRAGQMQSPQGGPAQSAGVPQQGPPTGAFDIPIQ